MKEMDIDWQKILPEFEKRQGNRQVAELFQTHGLIPSEGLSDNYQLIPKYSDEAVWEQVVMHSIGVMYVADSLAVAMAIPDEQRARLCTAALLHDINKKAEQFWIKDIEERFLSPWDRMFQVQRMLDAIAEMESVELASDVDINVEIVNLMHANLPSVVHEQSIVEKIMFFSDAVVQGSYDVDAQYQQNLVRLSERFDTLEKRSSSVLFSDSFVEKYGRPLFEIQRELGAVYEAEFADRLGLSVSDFYIWLENQVQNKIQSCYIPSLDWPLP